MSDLCSSALRRERDEIVRLQLQIASQLSNNTIKDTSTTTSPPLLKQQQILSQNQLQNFQLSTSSQSLPQLIPLSFFPIQTNLQQQQPLQIPQQSSQFISSSSPLLPSNFLSSPTFDFDEQKRRLFELQRQQQQFILEQQSTPTPIIDQQSFLSSQKNNSFLFSQQNSGQYSINSQQSSNNILSTQLSKTFQLNSDLSSLYSLISENTLIPLNQSENNNFIKEKPKNKKSSTEEIIFIENEEKINKNNNKESKRKLKEALIEKVNKEKEEEIKIIKIKEKSKEQNSSLPPPPPQQQLPQQQPSSSSQTTLNNNNNIEQISELNKQNKRSIPIFQITPQQLHLAMQQYFRSQQQPEEEEKIKNKEIKNSEKLEEIKKEKEDEKDEIIIVDEEKEEKNNKNNLMEINDYDEEDNFDEDNFYVDVVGDGEARSSLPKMQRKEHIEFYRKLKSFRNRGPQLDCQLCAASIPNNDTSIRSHIHGHCKTSMFVCKLCQKGFQDQHLVFEHIDREHPTNKGTKYIEDRRDMGLLVEILTQCFPRVFCRARDILFDAIGQITALTESKQQTKINCRLCGQMIPILKSCIYGHLSVHPSYKCKKCRFSCNDERSQLEHQKREHPDFPKEERCYCISLAFDVLLETLKSCFPIEQNEIEKEKQNDLLDNSSLFLHPGIVLKSKKMKNEENKEKHLNENKGKKRNLKINNLKNDEKKRRRRKKSILSEEEIVKNN
ncbi:hypothetical protein ACQ4LE_003115 [Meloidogyne hapla]